VRKFFIALSLLLPVQALTIKVDYRYDTMGFFENKAARDALEAAAERWSRIVDQELTAVNIQDDSVNDRRFRFFHPATGEEYHVSAAAGPGSDFLADVNHPSNVPVDEYVNGFTLEKDEWILYVGARDLELSDALGGAIAASFNVTTAASDPNSFINRGFNTGYYALGTLGGVVSFNLNSNWGFNRYDPGSDGAIDFYSTALHEIGHCFGFSAKKTSEWKLLVQENRFVGTNALAAYRADTGEVTSSLAFKSVIDNHWQDDTYSSKIFPLGKPEYTGTVGKGALQDLLMDPELAFTSKIKRLELTNVDIGAIKDIGWSVISEDPPAGPEIPLAFERSETGGIKLGFHTEEGVSYSIQTSTNGSNWLTVRPSLMGNGSHLTWEDGQEGFTDPYGAATDLTGKFYRIRKD
jgi:hypothetical protein